MIKQAGIEDSKIATELAMLLWPDNEFTDLEKELIDYIADKHGAIFLFYNEVMPVGFSQCSLRHDYVEGTESNPVGYLEGIFVREEYRKKGIGKMLLKRCEEWARSKGCTEFASDCELHNTESLQFHMNYGFEEANRIICFKKKL